LGCPLGFEGRELCKSRRRGTHALLDTLLRRSGRSHLLLHHQRLHYTSVFAFRLLSRITTPAAGRNVTTKQSIG